MVREEDADAYADQDDEPQWRRDLRRLSSSISCRDSPRARLFVKRGTPA
jgi:hypothetical protein